jgi:hypothetical protein
MSTDSFSNRHVREIGQELRLPWKGNKTIILKKLRNYESDLIVFLQLSFLKYNFLNLQAF